MTKKTKIGISVVSGGLALVALAVVLLVTWEKEEPTTVQARGIIQVLNRIAKGEEVSDEKAEEYVLTEVGLYELGGAAVPAMIEAVVDEQIDSGLKFRLLEMLEVIHLTAGNREPFLAHNGKVVRYVKDKKGDATVRTRAISYLTSLLDDRFSDEMIKILMDRDDESAVRADAANYLNHNTKVDAAPYLKQCVEKFYEYSKLRGVCATALGGYPTDETVDFLAKVIEEDVTIRGWAINGLGQIETPRATEALIARVRVETDGANMWSLAEHLVKRDSPEALETLLDVIRFGDPRLARNVAGELSEAGRTEAIPVIEEAIRRGGTPGHLQILLQELSRLKAL